ncbi:LysR family transcriptional regulator [Rubellimicrobium mesophilum]|nr:LysR family transcriptional regulator [Rubellimicrobium mesophilum]
MAEADARVFVSVADTGSFTAAAALHDMSPSAVSKAVSRLEAALGVRLLTRTTRALHLTEEGTAFHERCARAFRLLAEAAEEVTAGTGEVAGTVRLGLPSLFGTYLVAPRLASLLEAHPRLQVEIVTTMRLSDVVERGLDLAVVVGPLPDSSLAARPLGYGQFVTVAAPGYLTGHPAPETPLDLNAHRCLGWLRPDGRVEPWRFREEGAERTLEPRVGVASDDMHHLAAMAEAGAGVAHLPLFAVARGLKAGSLARLLEAHDPAPKLASFVYPSGRSMPRRVRVLMEHLAQQPSALPGTSRNS